MWRHSTVKMNNFKKEQYFFYLLTNNTNKKQITSLLKCINNTQYEILKDICCKILDETIPLTTNQFKRLSIYKNFLRRLGNKRVSRSLLTKNYLAVIELSKRVIDHYEIYSKTSTNSSRKMGKYKRQTYKRNKKYSNNRPISFKSAKRVRSETTSSDSNQTTENEEEEEEERISDKRKKSKQIYSETEFTSGESEKEEEDRESEGSEEEEEEEESESNKEEIDN